MNGNFSAYQYLIFHFDPATQWVRK